MASRCALAQAKGPVRDRLARTGLLEQLGSDSIYLSVAQAVAFDPGGSTTDEGAAASR